MNRIIQRAEYQERTTYGLHFEYRDEPGAGYMFDCDQRGCVDESRLTDTARENLARCRENVDGKLWAPEILEFTQHWTEPAIARCDCGRQVTLWEFTNTCQCGRDYSFDGSLLAPRHMWGEETGETESDILISMNV